VAANPSNGDVVAAGEPPLSNGQFNGLILTNNEPDGSTSLSPLPTRTPSPGPIADARTVMGILPEQGEEPHQ